MTAVLTVTCDCCREPVEADRHVLRVESGPLRHRQAEGVDLCPACFRAFDVWLEAGVSEGRLDHAPTH
jgi:hypothetical protein